MGSVGPEPAESGGTTEGSLWSVILQRSQWLGEASSGQAKMRGRWEPGTWCPRWARAWNGRREGEAGGVGARGSRQAALEKGLKASGQHPRPLQPSHPPPLSRSS